MLVTCIGLEGEGLPRGEGRGGNEVGECGEVGVKRLRGRMGVRGREGGGCFFIKRNDGIGFKKICFLKTETQ